MGLFADGFKELKKASEPLYKTPKSIQETIEIMAVAENGLIVITPDFDNFTTKLIAADEYSKYLTETPILEGKLDL